MLSKSNHALWIALFSVLFCQASIQPHRNHYQHFTKGTFELGTTTKEASTRLGPPPNGFFHYRRRTSSNEYDLQLDFRQDDSESRLHPVARLSRVEIVIDRPIATKSLLADLPEAVALCVKGCSLLGVMTDPNFNYEPHIIVYPIEPTTEQTRLGALLGTNWRPEAVKEPWVPAIILRWKIIHGGSLPAVDWLSQPIETVTFTAVCPSIELMRGIHEKPLKLFPDHPPVKLTPTPLTF